MLIEDLLNYGKTMAARGIHPNFIPTPAIQNMLQALHTTITQNLGDFELHLRARWQRQLPLLEQQIKLLAPQSSLSHEHVTRLLTTILSPLALVPKQQNLFAGLVCITLAEQLAQQGDRYQSAIFSALASKYQHKTRADLLPFLEHVAVCGDFCSSGLSAVTPENFQAPLTAWLQQLPPDLAPSVADFFSGLQRLMTTHANQPHTQATIFHALCGSADDITSRVAISSSVIASNDPHAVKRLIMSAELPHSIRSHCDIKLDPVARDSGNPVYCWVQRIEISDANTIRDLAGVASDTPLTTTVVAMAVAEVNRLLPSLEWQVAQPSISPSLIPGQHLTDLVAIVQQDATVKAETEQLLKKLQPTLAIWMQQSMDVTGPEDDESPDGPSMR